LGRGKAEQNRNEGTGGEKTKKIKGKKSQEKLERVWSYRTEICFFRKERGKICFK